MHNVHPALHHNTSKGHPTCVTSSHVLAVYLLKAGDRSSGQVPDSVEHVGSVDSVVICNRNTVSLTRKA